MPPRLSDYARVAARAALARRAAPQPAEGVFHSRVWPRYVDVNVHMNYGAYLEVAELARVDWFVRTGVLAAWLPRRWQPVVGSLSVEYRRELRPLVAFDVHTRVTGWDRKAVVIEQRFTTGGGRTEHATLRLNVVVRGPDGVVGRDALAPTLDHVLPRQSRPTEP